MRQYMLSESAINTMLSSKPYDLTGASSKEVKADNISYSKIGVAVDIEINGSMTSRPDWFLSWLGIPQYIYEDIIEAVKMADEDESVSLIRLMLDSPGGEAGTDFIFAMDAIYNCKTKVIAVVKTANSAAFGLASQADEIFAVNEVSEFGSVGVAATMFDNPDVITITNRDSPDKRPDLKTDSGKEVIKDHLDDWFGVFSKKISRGRNVEISDVVENYGKGRVFLADEAIRLGMVDGYYLSNEKGNSAMSVEDKTASTTPPINTVASAPVAAAINELFNGQKEAQAHLKMAAVTGEFEFALKAVANGEAFDSVSMAHYQSIALSNMQKGARTQEETIISSDAIIDGRLEAADSDLSILAQTANLLNKEDNDDGII